METNQNLQNISNSFEPGLKGVFSIVSKKQIFCSWVFVTSVILSIITIIFINIFQVDLKAFIGQITDLVWKFLPSVLGFTVTGYAVIIGFSQTSIIEAITEKLGDSNYSLYQRISALFALNIMCQAITLIFAGAIAVSTFIESSHVDFFYLPNGIIVAINEIVSFLITFGLFISLIVVLQIVLNVFSFSQLIHFETNKEKKERDANSHRN